MRFLKMDIAIVLTFATLGHDSVGPIWRSRHPRDQYPGLAWATVNAAKPIPYLLDRRRKVLAGQDVSHISLSTDIDL